MVITEEVSSPQVVSALISQKHSLAIKMSNRTVSDSIFHLYQINHKYKPKRFDHQISL